MNVKYGELKKYVMPTVAVFVVITLFGMIFHGMIMDDLYLKHSHFFRPQDEICKQKYYMWLANLIFSLAFCYIYSKGHENKETFAQGIRFGLWVSLLIWLPDALISYCVYLYPKKLILGWLIGYTTQSILAGITVAFMYKSSK